ncbi:MAG: DinB family protein [Planctomycetaceae bacterium]|nr:DinB family protein [Planctomycetaceae bacterium]
MSSTAAHLIELARQVRGDTLTLLAAAPEPWLTWAPPGTSNHILWHAGHALWLGDVLTIVPITGRSELPAGWAETFGMDCRPVSQTRDWPARATIAQHLTAQLSRIEQLLAALPAERLSDTRPVLGRRSLVSAIVHGLHDEAKHQGEMYLLLKLRRARTMV